MSAAEIVELDRGPRHHCVHYRIGETSSSDAFTRSPNDSPLAALAPHSAPPTCSIYPPKIFVSITAI